MTDAESATIGSTARMGYVAVALRSRRRREAAEMRTLSEESVHGKKKRKQKKPREAATFEERVHAYVGTMSEYLDSIGADPNEYRRRDE